MFMPPLQSQPMADFTSQVVDAAGGAVVGAALVGLTLLASIR